MSLTSYKKQSEVLTLLRTSKKNNSELRQDGAHLLSTRASVTSDSTLKKSKMDT